MLPCQHAFCKQCLEGYQESREQQRDILVCSVCKNATRLPPQGINDLPTDFKLKSIVDVLLDVKLTDPVPTKSRELAPLPRPFLDYTAKARARPLLTVTSYGNNEPFGRPYGLAFGSNGIVVISDWKLNKLIFFDKHMKFKSVVGAVPGWFSRADCLNKPCGMAADQDGNIYVADRDNHCVKKFSILGKLISKIGTGKPGLRNGEFNEPRGLVVSSKNILYIVDGLNHRIQVYNGDKFQFSFGSLGSEQGKLNLPRAVALNSNEDQLFVADNKNSRVQVFSTVQGAFLREIVHDKLQYPQGISYNGDGHLFVCSSGTNSVVVFREDGTLVTTIEGNLDGEERFNTPAEAKLNNNGQIIILSKCSIVVL